MSVKKNENNSSPLTVTTHPGTSPEIVSLLERTVFGTKGKVRYRQKNIAKGMSSKSNLEFIQIKKRDQILGTTGIVTRSTTGLKDNFKSLYVRYLSISNPFRKQKKISLNQAHSKKKRVSNQLKKMIGNQITDHFEIPIITADEKASFYAFVESENFNSKELCINLGFYPTRKISTILFSRFYPQELSSISRICDVEKEEVKAQLASFYKNHSFYFEDQLFESGITFVLRKDNKIVAGIRCKPVHWEIVELPGMSGFFMQNVLPYLPVTKKLFNPENLTFLAFDYAWTSNNNIEYILELMSHACAQFEIHFGMYWGDKESKLISELKESKKLGFINTLNGDITADVMLRFINMNEHEQAELISKPVFVSALDNT
tara:strand:- start:32441 stop:33562 length:1122 start_codon:yes stop_codon:yes gene_type:complete